MICVEKMSAADAVVESFGLPDSKELKEIFNNFSQLPPEKQTSLNFAKMIYTVYHADNPHLGSSSTMCVAMEVLHDAKSKMTCDELEQYDSQLRPDELIYISSRGGAWLMDFRKEICHSVRDVFRKIDEHNNLIK